MREQSQWLRVLFAVVAMCLAANRAFALCNTDERSANNVTTFKNNVNADLNDYGIIFEEVVQNPACVDSAATALYKKVRETIGSRDYPAFDVNLKKTVTQPYGGWLQGGNVSIIYATALKLGTKGKLSKPLDDLLGQIQYSGDKDAYCGFDSAFAPDRTWTKQNSCTDDYAIQASGLAWRAAYNKKRLRGVTADVSAARAQIAAALSSNDSICIYTYNVNIPAPQRGPCVGAVFDLIWGSGEALALHNGDAMPYGIGLMTSIGSAAVGLAAAGSQLSLTQDEKTVAEYLRLNGIAHTLADGSYFRTDCWTFWKDAAGNLQRSKTFECREPGYSVDPYYGYRPKMFPVDAFYKKYAPYTWTPPGFQYDAFDSTLFCSTNCASDEFFGAGRRVVYNTMGNSWINTAPALSGTISDYATTFRTYNGHFLSAANGGGAEVNAVPSTVGVNENFSMFDLNGGTLYSGDQVYFQSRNGD
ncbi:MAG TPA: hypothetical protein VF698_20300, partial [Thermoanaerobaculia bacterium]